MSEPTLSRNEAEDLIGRAAEMDHEDAEKLTRVEVIEAAREAGVSEASVHKAIQKDEQEKVAANLQRAYRRDRRKAFAKNTAAIVVVVLVSALVAFGMFHVRTARVRDEITTRMEAIRQHRADVHSAMQRQTLVRATWENPIVFNPNRLLFSGSVEYDRAMADRIRVRDAEITGAENRVHIAVRRYDAAVADYNRYAESFGTPVGFPRHVPYADEVSP